MVDARRLRRRRRPGRRRRRAPLPGAAGGLARDGRARPEEAAPRDGLRVGARTGARPDRGRDARAPSAAARDGRGTDRGRGLRRADRRPRRRRDRAAGARASTGCACSWPSSTTRARSSSRTPRTSCERRSSPSGDSSSCSPTRSSTTTMRVGFLRTMQGQVERLAKLSTDLLDLSRVDAGQLNVASEPVELGGVARALASELEHLAVTSGHVLEVSTGGEAWTLADEERVVQVGRALVVNGLVHTPAGTRVRVRTRASDGRAELAVEDDGPGIPASTAGRGLRALLPGRGGQGVGERPRACDRARAREAHGRRRCGSSRGAGRRSSRSSFRRARLRSGRCVST